MDLVISKHMLGTQVIVKAKNGKDLQRLLKAQIEFFVPKRYLGNRTGGLPGSSSVRLRWVDETQDNPQPVLDVIQTGNRNQYKASLPSCGTQVMSINTDPAKERTVVKFSSGNPHIVAVYDRRSKRRVLPERGNSSKEVGAITAMQGLLVRKVHIHVPPGHSYLYFLAVALSLMEKEYIFGLDVSSPSSPIAL